VAEFYVIPVLPPRAWLKCELRGGKLRG